MNNKKGFALVEIIVCITLIILIAVTSTIIVINIKKNETNILKNNSKNFTNALNIYLSNHNEIINNLNKNVKASAITLELLKNEGLIKDNLKIDYTNNYFLLSNAKMISNTETETNCENDIIGIEVFAKWDLTETDAGKNVIYICPKNDNIENLLSNYKAFGNNPNNYIKIEDKLWRIIESTNEGTYAITTNKEDLINYETVNSNFNDIDISSNYYANYADHLTFIGEKNADSGHRGLDAGLFYLYEANIGILNYTTIMNSTSASGNWIINTFNSFNEKIYVATDYLYFSSDSALGYFDVVLNNSERNNAKIVPFIKIKECYKIISGTGTKEKPYLLQNNCS